MNPGVVFGSETIRRCFYIVDQGDPAFAVDLILY